MKVWLPLYRKVEEPIFQSHRIMLTFGLTIYPLGKCRNFSCGLNNESCVLLAIVVEEAVILGAMSEFENLNAKTFCSITKTVSLIRIVVDRCCNISFL